MKVLVQYNSTGTQPVGIWWLDPDTASPVSEYLVPDGPEALRGKLLVFSKSNPKIEWSDWFDMLTTRSPYFEDWATYDSQGMSPHDLLQALLAERTAS